jgi:hypothetical protein
MGVGAATLRGNHRSNMTEITAVYLCLALIPLTLGIYGAIALIEENF